MNLTAFVLPAVICFVLIYALIKKTDILSEFTKGAAEGLNTAKNLLPPLVIMVTVIEIMRSSGAIDTLTAILSKPADALGIPDKVLPLVIIKPFSGSGSFAVIEDIFSNYGADSFIGKVASVIAGSTETTFYTIAVYYGAVGITKTKYTLPAALAADLTGFVLSSILVKLLL